MLNPQQFASPVAEFDISSANEIGFSDNGNRYIGGTITPSVLSFIGDSEVYVVEMDAQAAPINTWRRESFDEIQLTGITQLSNGD